MSAALAESTPEHIDDTELELKEGGFYTHVDGSTLVITKLLATAVKFVRLGAKAKQKSKDIIAGKTTLPEEKLTLKQFRAAVVGVADVPLPQVGDCYRQPREGVIDDYELDAQRIVAISDGKIETVGVSDYGDHDDRAWRQKHSLASFVTEYSERVYIPTRLPVIAVGGVYRDHGGAILRVLRIENTAPGKRKSSTDDVVVFTLNGGDYEYREIPKFLRHAIAATLDASSLTNESLAEADYAVQVSTALSNLRTANEAVAEADEAKNVAAAALGAARSAHKKALANLNSLSKGQPMLPGVHAAIVAGEKLAAKHDPEDPQDG